jgi:acyl dehydratase
MASDVTPAVGPTIFFEDFSLGQTIDLGSSHAFTEDAIIAFARQFDPQPFHLDPAAARVSIFGGLVASGWHTVAEYMHLLVERVLSQTPSMGSPGVEEVRWPSPVRPGDVLKAEVTVVALRPSLSRPEMGIVRWKGEAKNQSGEVVLAMAWVNFIGRRKS